MNKFLLWKPGSVWFYSGDFSAALMETTESERFISRRNHRGPLFLTSHAYLEIRNEGSETKGICQRSLS